MSANDLELRAAPVPIQPGVFYFGPSQIQLSFGNGFRCVGGTTVHLPVIYASAGSLTHSLDFQSSAVATNLLPSTTWNFQAWYRDPAAGGSYFDLSDAVEISFIP